MCISHNLHYTCGHHFHYFLSRCHDCDPIVWTRHHTTEQATLCQVFDPEYNVFCHKRHNPHLSCCGTPTVYHSYPECVCDDCYYNYEEQIQCEETEKENVGNLPRGTHQPNTKVFQSKWRPWEFRYINGVEREEINRQWAERAEKVARVLEKRKRAGRDVSEVSFSELSQLWGGKLKEVDFVEGDVTKKIEPVDKGWGILWGLEEALEGKDIAWCGKKMRDVARKVMPYAVWGTFGFFGLLF